MSTLEDNQNVWSDISKENLSSKYEKCRNITEEIYKRINITFQIKKLETATQSDVSDHSDQIDSNELSNETDLFACDKSDSIPSSTEAEPAPKADKSPVDKYININNNEEKKAAVISKRPRKRFRKRVKKRQQSKPPSDSDGSSDEALPLSRMVEVKSESGSPDQVMGVPKIIIVTKDLKPRILTPDKKSTKKTKESAQIKKQDHQDEKDNKDKIESVDEKTIDKEKLSLSMDKEKISSNEAKTCEICNLPFRGERGLRRHIAMSHISPPEEVNSGRPDRE